ncbi:hypothetical protein R1flu_026357 [Riccia fluitans]|uniref:Bet v I/Major latex protein domain-containing protein n=1 Tax=Riccia fluitans TaxID=41844 RepID=A0ABD1XGA9_9MARC
MAQQKFSLTVDLALSASRLWAALKSFYLVFPHLAPDTKDTMEVVEGMPGEEGSIVKISLGATPGGPVGAYSKEKTVRVDEEKMILVNMEIEGGHLSIGFKKWLTTTRLVPSGEKAVKMEVCVEYECDPTDPVCDMVVEQSREGISVTFKAVEVYLHSSDAFK